MTPSLAAYLSEHARWFVFGAWLLSAITIVAGLPFALMLGIKDSYGDPQLVYPIHGVIVSVIAVAALTSLIVAILASIAFATEHRMLASALVGSISLTLIGGSTAALTLTPRGPQELFDHYVGYQRLLLPRHNKAPNEATVAAGGGFDFVTCLTPFGELDRSRCQSGTLVSVRPRESGLKQWKDASYWSENWREMERLDDAIGHEAFIGGTYQSGVNTRMPYYVRRDETGSLVRLVRCYGTQGPCEHYTLVGNYALYYRTAKAELPQWSEIDGKLVQLIDSWRASKDRTT
jgi:hypothetical protein